MVTLLNRSQVLERLGNKSVSWLYEEMAAGRVPSPIKLGKSSVAWVASEIDHYIATRIAEGRVTLTARPRKRKSRDSNATPPDQAAA